MTNQLQHRSCADCNCIDSCKVCVLVIATANDGKLKIVGMKKVGWGKGLLTNFALDKS